MAESIVTDWLADYATLEPSELRTFAAEHEHNHEISHALFTIINERLKYPDVSVKPLANQFKYLNSQQFADSCCTRSVISCTVSIGPAMMICVNLRYSSFQR